MVEVFQARQPDHCHFGEHRCMTAQPHAAEGMIDDLQHGKECDGACLAARCRQIHAEAGALQEQFGAAAHAR